MRMDNSFAYNLDVFMYNSSIMLYLPSHSLYYPLIPIDTHITMASWNPRKEFTFLARTKHFPCASVGSTPEAGIDVLDD